MDNKIKNQARYDALLNSGWDKAYGAANAEDVELQLNAPDDLPGFGDIYYDAVKDTFESI